MTKWILVSLLVLVAVGTCFGQTAQPTWYFAGARADFEPSTSYKVLGGIAFPLGQGFYVMPQVDIGNFDTLTRSASVTGDISKSIWTGKYGSVSLLFAPSYDWVNAPSADDVTGYINAAVGGFGLFHLSSIVPAKGGFLTEINKRVSLFAGVRYKTAIVSSARWYPKGWMIGAGVAVRRI